MPREDVEIQDLIRENIRYYNQFIDGKIPFNFFKVFLGIKFFTTKYGNGLV